MSGEAILLPADAGGILERLVAAAACLLEVDLGEWALVGGLAVMAQLEEAHRPTADIDTAARNDHQVIEPAIDFLVATRRATREDGHIYIGEEGAGTKLDVIDVYDFDERDLPDDDEIGRAFVITHDWAISSARETVLGVTGPDGAVLTRAVIPLAVPASLVAIKLQSHLNPRRAGSKQTSDVYDMYRLLRQHDHDRGGGVSEALAAVPHGLAGWLADTLERTFVSDDGAALWARRLRVQGQNDAMSSVSAEDLQVVGGLALERLRRAIRS